MDRRSFLKRLGIGAAVVTTAHALSGVGAGSVRTGALYIPPERLAFGVPSRPLFVPDLPILARPKGGSFVYDAFKRQLLEGDGFDWSADTVRVALIGEDGREVSGPGYARQPLNGRRIKESWDGAAHLDAADVSWEAASIQARYAFLMSKTEPIAQIDFGAEQSSSDGTFTIAWHPSGIMRLA